ncbi:cysteine protease [Lithospermum erythrorhizon]|uniref:Cysteine protease n=1 Tax=Lithospermum erythrorhizon TaxID=34254 RepID=A0AAV3QJ19_LITER
MAEDSHKVTLNVYDLSQGLARQLSSTFLGKVIEGIWHTGIVVYGNEYYFGGGIQHEPAGRTPYGTPVKVFDLGETQVPKDLFETYLQEISPRYTAETYSLLTHNCNNFSNEVAQFLVGTNIPEYILNLPTEVMSSPTGALMMPMIQQLEATLRAGAVPQTPQFRPAPLASVSQPPINVKKTTSSNNGGETKVTPEETPGTKTAPPAEEAAGAQKKSSGIAVAGDPMGDARSQIQEEIMKEFAAIMATGTLRASEAAALATKRVMQRHGHTNVAQS